MALPATVPTMKQPNGKVNPKLGVGLMAWSGDGKYLATRNDNMPTAVWIWVRPESVWLTSRCRVPQYRHKYGYKYVYILICTLGGFTPP